MSEKRFIIDVEDEFQENAVFFGEEFLCFEDDSESLVSKLNEQQATISQLEGKVKRLNAFLVEQGLATEYVRWNKESDA